MEAHEPNPAREPIAVPTLSAIERRVLGVLAEKLMTTPEYYPMTVAGLTAGCNQKSNRDPVSNYDQDDVIDTLEALRRKGAVARFEASTGRVDRWRHLLLDWLRIEGRGLAVVVELLLRGPQTLGELRVRASRMSDIPDLPALEETLARLSERRLVVQLTPSGQKRGVIVTHGLYPPEELERLRQKFGRGGDEGDDPTSPISRGGGSTGGGEELAQFKAELAELKTEVARLAADLADLRARLGEGA